MKEMSVLMINVDRKNKNVIYADRISYDSFENIDFYTLYSYRNAIYSIIEENTRNVTAAYCALFNAYFTYRLFTCK